jgi:hypothetical protein
MTYAIIGAGLVGATLARFSPPRTFRPHRQLARSRNPRRTRPRDRATRHAHVGFPSFTARFPAEQEGLQRVELTRSANIQRPGWPAVEA